MTQATDKAALCARYVNDGMITMDQAAIIFASQAGITEVAARDAITHVLTEEEYNADH